MCIRLLHDNVMRVIIENGSCLVLKPNGSKVADGLTPPTLSDLFGP